MRILAAGDIHNREILKEKIVEKANSGNYDLFLGLGDYYTADFYLDFVKKIKIRKLCITGNRDFNFETPADGDFPDLYNYLKVDLKFNKENYKVVLIGATFPANFKRDILEWLKDFDSSRIIFVSHYPPYLIRDWSDWGVHAGIKDFRELIIRIKPILWLCGHIHEDAGISKFLKTTVINAAVCEKKKAYGIKLDSGLNVEEISLV
jgi:Icc-related predicted phosphoesterase